MANLLLFEMCRRALVDMSNKQLSLIDTLHEVNVNLPGAGIFPPAGATAPFDWTCALQWRIGDEDRLTNDNYELEIVKPDGSSFPPSELILPTTDPIATLTVTINLMPIDIEGSVRAILRRVKSDGSKEEVASRSLLVKFSIIPTPEGTATETVALA